MDKFRLDFVGIGAEKSATDWIASCLREHPEVCFSNPKEIHFFEEHDPHLLRIKNLRYARGLSWYKKHFSHCRGGLKGEFSPTYMYSKKTAKRIKKHFPKVKIIASLRNPVERILSQYLFDKRVGVIRDISFEQAIKQSDNYFEKGLYYKYLQNYYSFFPTNRILVILVDDIIKNPKKVTKSCYKFLGLKDINFAPQCLYKKINIAFQAGFPTLNYILLHAEYYLKKKEYRFLLRILEEVGIRRLAVRFDYYVNRKPLREYPKLNKNTAKRLRLNYLPDIIKLEKLLGRDLSFWKESKL